MTIKFTIQGVPFGKQRPRHNRNTGTTYTPQETREHEELIALAYRQQIGEDIRFQQDTPISMTVNAYMPVPKRTSKVKRARMLTGEIRPTIKPDWDNLGKLAADALNGVAYNDDKSIVDAQVHKFYSENPRTEIILIGD